MLTQWTEKYEMSEDCGTMQQQTSPMENSVDLDTTVTCFTIPSKNAEGVSKKRPRSETLSDHNSTIAAVKINKNLKDDNAIANNIDEKKNNFNDNGGSDMTLSCSSNLTFEQEIIMASSEATARLLSSSLNRLIDGIPKRELKLIISDAVVCEAALKMEIRILKESLKLEHKRRQQKASETETAKFDNSPHVSVVEEKGYTELKSKKAIGFLPNSEDDKKSPTTNDTNYGSTITTNSMMLTPNETKALETMLDTEFTPTDTCLTLSALLGRLRHELATPLPPRSQLPMHRGKQGLTQLAHNVGLTSSSSHKKRGLNPELQTLVAPDIITTTAQISTKNTTDEVSAVESINADADTSSSSVTPKKTSDETITASATSPIPVPSPPTLSLLSEASQFKRLAFLSDHAEYSRRHATPDRLLAVWKKLTTHRCSLVFRRPVNTKEAPGYADRIRFPMDLSLIRKLILSKEIETFEGILKQIHLIGHNCVKYNGRESDYALVAREFESVATEYVWNAVMRKSHGGGRGRLSENVSPMSTASAAVTGPSALVTTAVAAKIITPAAILESTKGDKAMATSIPVTKDVESVTKSKVA